MLQPTPRSRFTQRAAISIAALITSAALAVALSMKYSPADEFQAVSAASQPASQPELPPVEAAANADVIASGLRGSKHDFSSQNANGELCRTCHNPHLQNASAPLLDNRPASTQPLRAYQAIGINLNSASLKCVSCHDGVIAPDVFNGAHGIRTAGQLGVPPRSGPANGHPVGIAYPDGKRKFRPMAAVLATPGLKLPDGRIQCVTCHDPHNSQHTSSFLVISNEHSRLCLTCHQL